MRRILFALAIAFGVALLAAAPAAATAFTVSPWAYACGKTTNSNPATATDPGGDKCPHPDQAGGYCGEAGDTPGEAASAFEAGKLTLTKDGAQCDDLSAGAGIGGLTTLTAASVDCTGTCSPGGGAPRLNVIDSAGKFYFVGGTADGVHITFDVSALEGKQLKSIDVVYDLPGTAVLSNLSFTGSPAPTPTPTVAPSPSASSSATPHATAAPVPVLAQTGGGTGPLVILSIGLLLLFGGLISLILYGVRAKRR